MKCNPLAVLLLALVGLIVTSSAQAFAAPANDAFAASVSLGQGTVNGTTVGATAEPGEPDHYGVGKTVWYRWTAPGTGGAKVSVCGSGNTVAVYTGSSVGALTEVTVGACDRVWPAKAGVTYR